MNDRNTIVEHGFRRNEALSDAISASNTGSTHKRLHRVRYAVQAKREHWASATPRTDEGARTHP
eukprot:1883374-Pyramimonas_sp.AAC.1